MDGRSSWIMLGNAIRLAQMMGLHRDRASDKQGPLETEIRRRVWNKLRLLDLRLAEELGFEPSITESSYDTEMPRDIDDEELTQLNNSWMTYAGSADTDLFFGNDLPISHSRKVFTEMTFSLLRYDLAHLLNKLLRPGHGGPAPLQALGLDNDKLRREEHTQIDAILLQLRRKYHISMWTMENGLHRLAMLCVNTQIAKARLLVDLQFRGSSESLRQK